MILWKITLSPLPNAVSLWLGRIGVLATFTGLLVFASLSAYSGEPDRSAAAQQAECHEFLSLEQARQRGRAKSAFLLESKRPRPALAGPPKANLADFKDQIGPLFTQTCVMCHGPDTMEGNLRIDQLDPDLLHGPDVAKWLEVFGALSNGEMPPGDETEHELTAGQRTKMIEWLAEEIQKASLVRRNQGDHSSVRRLTKYEYNYALQDLLGLPYEFADNLPPENVSEDGFKNSSDMLQMSAMQFQIYQEIGLQALRKATVQGDRPQLITYPISMQHEMASIKKGKFFQRDDKGYQSQQRKSHLLDMETGKGIHYSGASFKPASRIVPDEKPAKSPVVLVLSPHQGFKMNLGNHLPDEGIMRVRIRVGRTTNDPHEYASLRLIFGAHTSNNANFSQTISKEDLPVVGSATEPQFITFEIPLSEIPRNPFRKNKTTFPRRDELLTIQLISNSKGGRNTEPLAVHIDHIQISAPFYREWPPQSHRNIFIDSKHQSDENTYAREVLSRFMERAWSRPVSAADVDGFMDLFLKHREDFANFEDAMLEVLATVLATPEFLYRIEKQADSQSHHPSSLSDLELAKRISFFLWSSIPDEELVQVARQEKLSDPQILHAQVERMLADPRSERFSRHFVQQWLGLDGLENAVHVSDPELKTAMAQEPIAFFNEVRRRNASVLDFLHSDYLVLNERLAGHYRIPTVYGPHFRPVPIESKTNRGGILTSAAVLTMNSDGKDSHPVKRGVWLLEHVLHDPPPPPPPNVPEVDLTDPNILKMTLKERILNHRDNPACKSCHVKIDPWGIAFENYDALGLYRTTIQDKPVDASAKLFNQQQLSGVEGLKRYLLTDRQDQFVRAMVHKMTAYALGRPLTFSDRADLDQLTVEFRKRGDGLRDLVHLIIHSDMFRTKRK